MYQHINHDIYHDTYKRDIYHDMYQHIYHDIYHDTYKRAIWPFDT